MKKGKIIAMPTSLEAQIRTRARNLSIDKCYVNENWEDTKMASVVVTRRHTNDNITYGFFLVDLSLLGVKDCFYDFNASFVDLEDRLANDMVPYVEIEYDLAHNIIYGSIAFAEDCGFEPVKDFTKTAIYILEEDTDDFPLMDIPLGHNGLPAVLIKPGENRQREIAILEKTVGPDNYVVFFVDDYGVVEMDDDDDIYDFDDMYEDVMDDIMDIGVEEYVAMNQGDLSPMQILVLNDIAYQSFFEFQNPEEIERTIDWIIDDVRFDDDLEWLPRAEPFLEQFQSIIDKMVDDEEGALAEMEALTNSNPDVPELGMTQISMLRDFNMMPEVEKYTLSWYERASDHYAIKLMYAEWLADHERFDELFELFGDQPALDALTTEDLPFTDVMVSEFCACYAMAWLAKDNIEKAEPYYRVLTRLDNRTAIINNALMAMMGNKKDAMIQK